jgi:imidazole glycerol-phosphate synthase subunit HisH
MIAIIDYGMGNLRSVEKAFHFLGFEAHIVQDAAAVAEASHLVLPGDAAFGDAMSNLREGGWDEVIYASIEAGKPFLGICVGLQLMFEGSEEMGSHTGLGLLRGRCKRFPTTERVPQIGWNQISIKRGVPVLEGVPDGSFYYFVHSFYVHVEDAADTIATTDYGIDYTSIAGRDHVTGVQFHPEKSQDHGLRILANFAKLN